MTEGWRSQETRRDRFIVASCSFVLFTLILALSPVAYGRTRSTKPTPTTVATPTTPAPSSTTPTPSASPTPAPQRSGLDSAVLVVNTARDFLKEIFLSSAFVLAFILVFFGRL
jgi:hypothetical protein